MKSPVAILDGQHQTPECGEKSSLGLLHEFFEMQAAARPNAVAVDFGGQETTYADLKARANRLARHLRRRGVRRGSIVAMMLPRSVDAYAAILGILKAGAAYVPIDPEYPEDRAAYILEDSDAGALLSTEKLARRHSAFRGIKVSVDANREAIAAESPTWLRPDGSGVSPRDLCYIIYTSGSTGRPKGVMIEHRSAWHLVEAEHLIYGVRPEDRVYQGASLSFDLSVEEIWLAFRAGATLVAATPGMAHAGPDLAQQLAEKRITVLSCVPTLVAMLEQDIPTLRLLILGGEACPERLVERWSRPGRRLLNTYGPTETTVIATYAELAPGEPVTIGCPIPGYRVYLLNSDLRPVPTGEVGEICIGGVGVARGYCGLPGETRARFLPDPFAFGREPEARIYRTGDLGRLNAQGNIEFCGRADAQVKLRGFRIELSEIEAVMLGAEGVKAAACAVREDTPGFPQLVGYVVPRNGKVDEETLRAHLRGQLPSYMVPALIETIQDLPRLPSGKLDRAALPVPRQREVVADALGRQPHTDSERRIAEVWRSLFSPQPVSIDHDFFLDHGGHSLLAARMVSQLRKDPRFARVSVADVYAHPTIASLAAAVDAATPQAQPRHKTESRSLYRRRNQVHERRRYFFAGITQAAGLYLVFGFQAVEWVTPYLVYFLLVADGASPLRSAAWAAASVIGMFPLLVLVALAAKWVVLGRIRPGRHPLWGAYYLRWWLVHSLIESVPLHYLAGTPLLPIVYRLFGARIEKDVHLGTNRLAAFDLISIGEGTTIDDVASLLGYTVEDGELILGPVTVGRDCFVGTRAFLRESTIMEDGARLEDLSLLPAGARIPAGETWKGSPARRASRDTTAFPPRPAFSRMQQAATVAIYGALVLVIPVVLLGALTPGIIFLSHLDIFTHPWLYLGAAPLVGACFVLTLSSAIVALKWLILGRVQPGTYPVHGIFYVRNWLVDQLMALVLDLVGGLHATLYAAPWYRALGAKLGRSVELSTAMSTTADLLELGDGCTIADEVSLGAPRIENGWMKVDRTRLGRRAFVGNSGVILSGTVLGDESLVGVLSIAPSDPKEGERSHASWLGSPPICLPRREPSVNYTEARTYSPPRKMRLARGAFEILRVTLPPAGFILVAAAVIDSALPIRTHWGLGPMLALLPAVYAASCAVAALAVAAAKWALIGRSQPFARPLWSNFIWRLELQNALFEFFATPLVLKPLRGTPFLPWYYRLLGAKFGRQIYVATTGLLEFDLVEVGDRAALNDDCVLQTHLFEDRVLKASRLRIGADCTVGAESVILYDAQMEDGSRVDAISLLMKGETLPAGTSWAGIPATWQGLRGSAHLNSAPMSTPANGSPRRDRDTELEPYPCSPLTPRPSPSEKGRDGVFASTLSVRESVSGSRRTGEGVSEDLGA